MMVVISIAIYQGRGIKFWPPEILPPESFEIKKDPPSKNIYHLNKELTVWNGLFVDISERTGKPYLSNEKIHLSNFNDTPITGEATAEQEGIKRSWKYVGYRAGDFLVLSYDSDHDPTGIGTYFLERVSNDIYLGYWTGKTCSNKSIVRCPYMLTKNSINAAKDYYEKEKMPIECQELDIKNNTVIDTSFSACTN